MKQKLIYYITPVLLAILIFTSNFLSTDLFKVGFQNFTVWFVLSVFVFACGWLIDQTLGWVKGGKLLFAVIVVTSFFSVVLVSYFKDYFGLSDLLSESLILYTLRNITLGAMGFFGMAVSRVILYEKEIESQKRILESIDEKIPLAEKEAELLIKEARLKAEEMLLKAKEKSDDLSERKNKIENQLREFIKAEQELIKQYESKEE